MSVFKRGKIFYVYAKKVLQKYLIKEHAGFDDQHNIHFTILSSKIEFNLLHYNPFANGDIHKITFALNNLFKVTFLGKEGWDGNFTYNTHVIAELSQFMSTFEVVNEIDFNFLRNEIVESNVLSLLNGCFFS